MIQKFMLLFCFSLTLGQASISAQRFQVQLLGGFAGAIPIFNSPELITRSAFVSYDSVPSIQLGLAVQMNLKKGFHVRLEGNYRSYRTFFSLEQKGSGPLPISSIGNIYNEKLSISLLPGYSRKIFQKNAWTNHVYAFAGPTLEFELDNTYSYTFRFPDSYNISHDPGVKTGAVGGIGMNLRWKKIGILVELRGGFSGKSVENPLIPKVSYRHVAFLGGLSLDL
jgi:hypothetical protein